jgi:hypothetical protein
MTAKKIRMEENGRKEDSDGAKWPQRRFRWSKMTAKMIQMEQNDRKEDPDGGK